MGIDAKILVRYQGDKPTDDQLTRWSWDLCQAIGANHFLTEDGLEPEAYAKASAAWHAAYRAHPKQFNSEAIVADIGDHPPCLRRAIDLTNRTYRLGGDDDVPETHWAPGRAYTQDGDAILAEPGEWFLDVSLMGRFYGIGYERGDLLTLCAIAEWLELNLEPCQVWYGGDSSGCLAEPFDETMRNALKAHLYGKHGRDYRKTILMRNDRSFPTPKPCGLCVKGENRFNRFGWGGGGRTEYGAVSCDGCGKSFETHDAGVTWAVMGKDRA